jgi:carboxyl-terminal processing protease
MRNSTRNTTLGLLSAAMLLLVGIWLGGHPASLPGFLRSALTQTPRYGALAQALEDIRTNYYRPLSATSLSDSSISGAISSLHDPYADYETPVQYHAFTHPPAQQFSGIGVDVSTVASGLRIDAVLRGSPAMRAGLLAGDVIVAVGDTRLAGKSSATATGLIRGAAGTAVTLRIARSGRSRTVIVRRAVIATPLVTASLRRVGGVRIGVIELPTFDVAGIHADVANRLTVLLAEGAKGIVLDLRDNGGGLVSEARLVASLFIAHGVIVTTRGRTQPTNVISATGQPIAPRTPMVVLVNGKTASAAEIVTGALQDHRRAVVVGTNTYGKGVYQEILPLSNGGAIAFTVGEYFLPNGRNLGAGGVRRGRGLQPDVRVSAAPTATSDPALAAGLRILAAKLR